MFLSSFSVCQTAVDLVFILDSSGSVGDWNFDKVKNFVRNVIDFFNIGPDGTHVGIVTYSSSSELEFNLDKYTTKSALKTAVSNIPYRGGWTFTADAIDYTREKVQYNAISNYEIPWPTICSNCALSCVILLHFSSQPCVNFAVA